MDQLVFSPLDFGLASHGRRQIQIVSERTGWTAVVPRVVLILSVQQTDWIQGVTNSDEG